MLISKDRILCFPYQRINKECTLNNFKKDFAFDSAFESQLPEYTI